MVDHELLIDDATGPLLKGSLLSDLLETGLIQLYRYSDGGPPSGVQPRPGGTEIYEGWAVVTHADPAQEIWQVAHSTGPTGSIHSSVIGNAVTIAAREGHEADGLAAQVSSQALGAHIYVTDRHYLHRATWGVARGVVLCRPHEALPLVGLYLRAQGDFRLSRFVTCSRGLFYWVGARELLPASWRWLTACAQSGTASQDQSLTLLGQSLLQRVGRAFEARDGVHVALNQPQHNDTGREILARLDEVLVDLMGAVDAAARVAHRVLGLPSNEEHQAAWQKTAWIKKVNGVASALAAVVAVDTDGANTLTLLRRLRNSVHGTALQSIALQERMTEQQTLIAIPPQDEVLVLAAMEALGGREVWGTRRLLAASLHLDASIFVEALFPHVLALLNELMVHTPVETLPGVSLAVTDLEPPAPDPRKPSVWDPWCRTSIRWQLGL